MILGCCAVRTVGDEVALFVVVLHPLPLALVIDVGYNLARLKLRGVANLGFASSAIDDTAGFDRPSDCPTFDWRQSCHVYNFGR